jgi:hypothetical protein
MKIIHQAFFPIAFTAVAISTILSPALAEQQWHFKVKNNANSAIKGLYVSQDKEKWGYFDIGANGIAASEEATLYWHESTNNEDCKQYIKATFADGAESAVGDKIDFCADLDTPIEFNE